MTLDPRLRGDVSRWDVLKQRNSLALFPNFTWFCESALLPRKLAKTYACHTASLICNLHLSIQCIRNSVAFVRKRIIICDGNTNHQLLLVDSMEILIALADRRYSPPPHFLCGVLPIFLVDLGILACESTI